MIFLFKGGFYSFAIFNAGNLRLALSALNFGIFYKVFYLIFLGKTQELFYKIFLFIFSF